MAVKILFIIAMTTAIGTALARPQYYGHSASHGIGYGDGHNAVSNIYSKSNGYGHDFGYDVKDPKYGNYQGRQESGAGNSVQGSYYLMEADGSLRRVDYVADHPGGFRATVSDKYGSRTFGYDGGYDSSDAYSGEGAHVGHGHHY